jgi:hypothetical protein
VVDHWGELIVLIHLPTVPWITLGSWSMWEADWY